MSAGGQIELDALERRLAKLQGRTLVSLMLANNETGVVQPVAQAAQLVHAAGALLHVDAVQGVGRMACDINALGADFLTLSGHKIGGPKGALLGIGAGSVVFGIAAVITAFWTIRRLERQAVPAA